MSDGSKIEWTDATWNPTTGCTKVSPGCAHCYIERTPALRIAGRKFIKGQIPIELHSDRLRQPLRWRNPRAIFVNSLSDVFHEEVPDTFLDSVFAVMALADWHTFQVLTKRPERAASYVSGPAYGRWCKIARVLKCDRSRREFGYPLANVWLGTSCEDQTRADERIPHLLRCPAHVRFLSCEPILGPLNLKPYLPMGPGHDPRGDHWCADCARWQGEVQWVIAGGESGSNARPMHPGWVRSLRNQCVEAGVPFFFKQWGEWCPISDLPLDYESLYLSPPKRDPEAARKCRVPTRAIAYDGSDQFRSISGHLPYLTFRVGKKRAGRLLDGEEWNEFHKAAELAAV